MEETKWYVYKYENGFVSKEYSGTKKECNKWMKNRWDFDSPRVSYYIGKNNF